MNIQTRCTLRTRLSSEKRYDLLTIQKFYDMMNLIERQRETAGNKGMTNITSRGFIDTV